MTQKLPVEAVLPELCTLLQTAGSAILAAPPGSGKTTLAPLVLARQDWLAGKRIVLLEPRRLAARAAAARMAFLLGESVGETVGYRIRFEHRISSRTRIEVVTEGILARRLQHDPELPGVGLVIFDEFHERSLNADLALALCLDVRGGLREDLRLLVMSATLDTRGVSRLLGGAAIITAAGSSYPVTVRYSQVPAKGVGIADAVTQGIARAVREQSGDILAFLPGAGEIKAVARNLSRHLGQHAFVIRPLYGELDRGAQEQAMLPDQGGRRRIVLATSIAETSLTIEGVTTVVDSGWSRVPRFDPNTGLTRLETVRLSRSSADQRAGRAGRLAPGVCYRLWGESVQDGLQSHSIPEIAEADLCPLALELATWGVTRPALLQWLDVPPAGAFAQATGLLQRLEALDSQSRVTAVGQQMVRLPLHPRLAHMLVRSGSTGQLSLACDLAALVTERDIIRPPGGGPRPVDLELRLRLLRRYREGRRPDAEKLGEDLDRGACQRVDRASRQYQRLIKPAASEVSNTLSPGALLALAYPDRVARRRYGQDSAYLLASGRGARLPEMDDLIGSEYLVAAHLDAGRTEGRIYLAAGLTEAELRSVLTGHIREESIVGWDARSKSVAANRIERLGRVTLRERPLADPNPDAVLSALLEGIRKMGVGSLPWRRQSREWQTRVMSLRLWQPQSDWPDLSDQRLAEELEDFLAPYLTGMSRREHLEQLNLAEILKNRLNWEQRRQVELLAPTHVQVPSGSRKALRYSPGQLPVLAVRLQELFGLADTPRICNGRVPVILHLLSPAQRPIQITQDLRGFWDNTYREIRKELQGRYPKHYWPDDPWAAIPTARVRPR